MFGKTSGAPIIPSPGPASQAAPARQPGQVASGGRPRARGRLKGLLAGGLVALSLGTAPAPLAAPLAASAPASSPAPSPVSSPPEPAPTRFANLNDLARLPYFRVGEDGRLKLRAPLGPIIDFHTHLALAFGPPIQLDLYRLTDHAEHYLPDGCAMDLAPYANLNFSRERLRDVNHDLVVEGFGPGGMRATHTVPNLLREMDEMGIVQSVLLPIDMPFWSDNARNALAAAAREPRLVAFGSVHPHAFGAFGQLAQQAAEGARGFKMHPAVMLVRPDDPRASALYRRCGELGRIVFWHGGPVGIETPLGYYLSQMSFYERPIAENPQTTFILGHSGALQVDQAIRLARRYPNVYLELSSQGLPAIQRLIAEVPHDRLLFGSDWPFYHPALPLAKVLLATENRPWLRERILYGNAAKLLGLPPQPSP